ATAAAMASSGGSGTTATPTNELVTDVIYTNAELDATSPVITQGTSIIISPSVSQKPKLSQQALNFARRGKIKKY
ncbi:MAG TPA: hypothetical protein DCM40_46360, partial [Maribacter sp.]|nr:hypothetical protein [Maribacter sp.]